MRITAIVGVLLAASPLLLMAQNPDSMTHQELVEYLGVHSDFEDHLQEIEIRVSSRGEGAPTPARLFVGHVAENRFVIKLDTADQVYPREETVLHIYADIDDDRSTGREGSDHVAGTDMMYSFSRGTNDPRFFHQDIRTYDRYPVRGVIVGNTVYVADDVKVNVRDDQTHFRLRMLGERREGGQVVASASTPWTYVQVPLAKNRELPSLPLPEEAGFAHLTMPNFAELAHAIWNAEGTIRLRPEDAQIRGFLALMNDDLDGIGADDESVVWRSPVAGRYHVGLVMSGNPEALQRTRRTMLARDKAGQDPPASLFGVAGLDVLVAGEKIGTVVGHRGTGDVVHTSKEPVELEPGTPIQVRSAAHSSSVVFHSVHLTKATPAVPPLVIENLTTWHLPDEPGELPGRIMVAWTTNRPTEALVSYRTEPGGWTGQLPGRGLVNSHYVMLPSDVPGDVWELTVTCVETPQEDFAAHEASVRTTVYRDRAEHRTAQSLPASVSGQTVRIDLNVVEPSGVPRADWPVRSGVAVPEGVLGDPAAVRLLDAAGREVPLQTRATSWWPDGLSIRWLLLDFAASTTMAGPAQYTLEINVQPTSVIDSPVTVRAGTPAGDGPHPLGHATAPIEVDTGPLKWRLGEGGFVPFGDVTIHGARAPRAADGSGGFELTDAQGVVFSSALEAPEQIVVEQSGPQRATLRVSGRLVDARGNAMMRYLCRLHFFAGSPAVRTVFTLENDVLQPEMNLIESLRLTVPARMAQAQLSVGIDGKSLAMTSDGRLVQDEDFRVTLGDHQGHRADGWVLAAGSDHSLAIAVRDFWQTYPKG
ncbi:MAG: hypothetical protein EA424_02115, partial [Planctomycetaceae bacterium]